MDARTPYGPEEIGRYLRGEMTRSEMHALERAALEDPFLAEAMEGYQLTDQIPNSTIQELQERLSSRVKRGEHRSMAWAMSVAAGLVLSLSLGAWLFFRQAEPVPIAGTMERSVVTLEKKALPDSPKAGPVQTQKEQQVNDNKSESLQPENKDEEKVALSSETMTAMADQKAEGATSSAQKPSPAKTIASAEQKPAATDAGAGAVAATGQKPPSAVKAADQPSAPAVATMKARMPQQTMAAPTADSSQAAEPTIGWTAYRAYITRNIQKPGSEVEPKGEVVLSFLIDTSGRPYDVRVETKLSPARDQEAARLIREGPSWKPLKERVRVRYSIRF